MHFDLQTLALQTVNVLVLVWLLARFLFRPVARIISERRTAADAVLAEAEAARAKVAADAASLEQHRQALLGDGERIMVAARASAEAERDAIMRQADASSRKLRDESGWAPRYPSVREGWPSVVDEMNQARMRGSPGS